MTTEEIKTLIDQKIAGQGSMVDIGGALPTILKEIVDMAGQGGGGDTSLVLPEQYEVNTNTTITGSYEEIAEECGITAEQVEKLFAGDYLTVGVSVSLSPADAIVYAPAITVVNSDDSKIIHYEVSFQSIAVTLECTGTAATNELKVTVSLNKE